MSTVGVPPPKYMLRTLRPVSRTMEAPWAMSRSSAARYAAMSVFSVRTADANEQYRQRDAQ